MLSILISRLMLEGYYLLVYLQHQSALDYTINPLSIDTLEVSGAAGKKMPGSWLLSTPHTPGIYKLWCGVLHDNNYFLRSNPEIQLIKWYIRSQGSNVYLQEYLLSFVVLTLEPLGVNSLSRVPSLLVSTYQLQPRILHAIRWHGMTWRIIYSRLRRNRWYTPCHLTSKRCVPSSFGPPVST